MEAADFAIKHARERDTAALEFTLHPVGSTTEVRKASPDDPKHPGWPAGTEGGLGGKFRPKNGSEDASIQQLRENIARRALRIAALAVLSLAGEVAAESLPGIDFAATAAIFASMAKLIAEFEQLEVDVNAAIKFVNDGPYDLADLQVSSTDGYQQFSSYEEFCKRILHPSFITKWAGPAGDGSEYHHIVTQGGNNADNFSPEQLQNTDNIIILPTLLHEAVNAEYSQIKEGTNMTVYEWLQSQSYEVQYQEGLRILQKLHILK